MLFSTLDMRESIDNLIVTQDYFSLLSEILKPPIQKNINRLNKSKYFIE